MSAVANTQSRTIVTAPAHRNCDVFVARKIYRCHYVCRVRATNDSVRTTIDHSIVHSPGDFVFVAPRGNDAAPQVRSQIPIRFFSHTRFESLSSHYEP